jgi:hypothetical protein
MIGMLGVGLLLSACPGPGGQGNSVQTGPQGGSGEGTDTSVALTSEQLEEIQRTVRNGKDAITHCYTDEMERRNDRKLTGKVVVKILIGTSERAEQVVIGETTLKGTEFQTCIVDTVKGWEFPKINSPSWFTYPFEFSPAY